MRARLRQCFAAARCRLRSVRAWADRSLPAGEDPRLQKLDDDDDDENENDSPVPSLRLVKNGVPEMVD